jgi:small-conductance mechanosensitive channel
MAPLDDAMDALAGLPDWQAVPLVVVASLVAARIVQVGGDAVVRRLTATIEGELDDVVLRTVHPAIYVSVVLAGLYLATVPLGIGPDTDAGLRGLVGDVQAAALTLLTVVWAVTLVRLGGRVSHELLTDEDERFDRAVVPIVQNAWSALVLGVSVFLVLAFWNVDVTPLLASAGILGIVVGFAARDTIANLFGSIALYADGTYTVGDWVVLESGVRGRVEDVSIRSTTIRTRDDVLITVPNATLNAAQITNESTPDTERRVRIPLGVAYGTDLDRVEELLLGVAAEESLVLERPRPRVRFRSFGDSALDIELLCWIPDPVLRGRATHRLNRAVYDAFAEAGVEVPFPQREVTVVGRGDGRERGRSPAPETARDGAETPGGTVPDPSPDDPGG